MPSDVPLRIPTEIETERLLIRCPKPGDGVVVHASVLESLPVLRKCPASLPWAMEEPAVDASERFCCDGNASYRLGTNMPMLVFLKDDNAHVGNVGLHDFHWQVPKCEIGFWGRSTYSGRGLITEAVQAVTSFGLDRLGMRRIEALPDEDNRPSCRLCERAGYMLEGTLKSYRAWTDRIPRNARVYAVVR
jgi:RimJ/RimL family protein N-acetyltransferase